MAGTIVADGGLENLTLAEISAWLCLFLREVSLSLVPRRCLSPSVLLVAALLM